MTLILLICSRQGSADIVHRKMRDNFRLVYPSTGIGGHIEYRYHSHQAEGYYANDQP